FRRVSRVSRGVHFSRRSRVRAARRGLHGLAASRHAHVRDGCGVRQNRQPPVGGPRVVVNPIRVTAVLTHPVQYYAPWFRWIHANCRDLDLHVIYASSPTPCQQGTGFDREFAWDVPLTEGYQSTVVRAAGPADRFDSEHFWGLNVPEIANAIAGTRPDVVIVFGWYSVTLIRAIRSARRLKIPVL